MTTPVTKEIVMSPQSRPVVAARRQVPMANVSEPPRRGNVIVTLAALVLLYIVAGAVLWLVAR